MRDISILTQDNIELNILCLGAHCDDIEIGCGGTILKLLEIHKSLRFHWIVLSSDNIRAKEAYISANKFLETASEKQIIIREFRDGFFPYLGYEIKDLFEEIKEDVSPDIIFTHYRDDLHQDHRLVNELTWNTFRDHLILEYEIPKYDGDLGSPNFFVHLSKIIGEKKSKILLESFPSQTSKRWFRKEIFESILFLRGIESNAPEQFAEGFFCRKLVLI